MSKNKTWAPPGWPWELDILALVFLVIALVVPYTIFTNHATDSTLSANPAALKLKEQTYMLWSIGIVVLFVMHLALAGNSDDAISPPFVHLISPLVFAGLAYYRIYAVTKDMEQTTWVTGNMGQISILVAAVFLLSLIVARLRMARHLHRFRDTQWDLVSPAKFDRSYFELIAQFRPLVYPPRRYHLSESGLLVEGWFYTIVVPFESVQSVSAVRTMSFSAAGHYYASSTGSLMRLERVNSEQPMFISPEHRDEFVQYCAQHVALTRPSAKHHSRHGTHPGVTARGTQSGQTHRVN